MLLLKKFGLFSSIKQSYSENVSQNKYSACSQISNELKINISLPHLINFHLFFQKYSGLSASDFSKRFFIIGDVFIWKMQI